MIPDLNKALLSLDGLSVGDAFGQQLFLRPELARSRSVPPEAVWYWTDDTHMALSIVEVLGSHSGIDQDVLARKFADRYFDSPLRGYAQGAAQVMRSIRRGEEWRQAAAAVFPGGSFGNGGAMRAAPIGGAFAGEPAFAAQQADLSASVTHLHLEGRAGAMAVAAAAAIAGAPDPPRGVDFLRAVLVHVPESDVTRGTELSMSIAAADFDEAVGRLGTGAQTSAQDTVPFCLWSAAHNLSEYEEALWKTVQGGGDQDTTCAIVGGIVALSAKNIPAAWLERREPLQWQAATMRPGK